MLQGIDDPPLFTHDTRQILSDQLDPRIELEYNKLVDTWTQQLLTEGPQIDTSVTDAQSIRFSCMRLMHRYLDQQWIDSQQMLQCAQAWNSYPSLSPVEAVHTMNILSLRTMQRSIDARREFLHALGDGVTDHRSIFDLSLPLSSNSLPTTSATAATIIETPFSSSSSSSNSGGNNNSTTIPIPIPAPAPGTPESRDSFALSEEEVHAPLLRTQKLSYPQLPEPLLVFHPPSPLPRYRRDSVWTHPHGDPIQAEEKTEVEPFSPRESNEATSEPIYQRLSTWKKLVGNQQIITGLDPEDQDPWQSLCGPGFLSSLSSSSLFPKDDHKNRQDFHDPQDLQDLQDPQDPQDPQEPPLIILTETETDFEDVTFGAANTSPQPLKSALRAHHIIHDPLTLFPNPGPGLCSSQSHCPSSSPTPPSPPSPPSQPHQQPTPNLSSPILRSESSISAFRPISKNLAPRCKVPTCSVRDSRSSVSIRSYANSNTNPNGDSNNNPSVGAGTSASTSASASASASTGYNASSSASSSVNCSAADGLCTDSAAWKINQKKPTITKSSSVPTTVGRSTTYSSKASPPLPTTSTSTKIAKERNFVMRSIVSKKASLGKLFAGKKAPAN
ncbi:hypothetical protein J3Q64DRAFT_1835549 [Phycomyces blakesleeanus]|uniref:Uncharacterized protein n=1 Tax=Phycomyces blakesleeanus TaxID=4837 RepID=A0ABR3B1A4_PHYBL